MNGLWLWFALIGAELLLIVFALLLVYWIRGSARAARDRKAVKTLIAKVRKAKAEREQRISRYVEEFLGLQGDAADRARVRILREEVRLIQRFYDLYKKHDAAAAAQFYMPVESAVEPYLELDGGGQVASSKGDDAGANGSDLEALQAENLRLSEELSVTMDTMSRMLSEYSTMFAGNDQAAAESAQGPDMQHEPGGEVQQDEPMADRQAVELDEQELDIGEIDAEQLVRDVEEAQEVGQVSQPGVDETALDGGGSDSDSVREVDEIAEVEFPGSAQPAGGSVDLDGGLEADAVDDLLQQFNTDSPQDEADQPDTGDMAQAATENVEEQADQMVDALDLDELFDGVAEQSASGPESDSDPDDDTRIAI